MLRDVGEATPNQNEATKATMNHEQAKAEPGPCGCGMDPQIRTAALPGAVLPRSLELGTIGSDLDDLVHSFVLGELKVVLVGDGWRDESGKGISTRGEGSEAAELWGEPSTYRPPMK